MLVMTGATGNIGSKITMNLLKQGKKVRVIGRDAKRLQPFVDKGAEAAVGDLTDVTFLTKAFQGATAVWAMIPPNMRATNVREYQNKVGECIATAIKNAGVKHVVNLSSLGAHLSEKAGIVQGLRDQEERLNKIDNLNVVHLRPAIFMENLLATIETIKSQNIIGSPLDGSLRFPAIATQDIADEATKYLTGRNFKGHMVRNLLGPRDVNYNEIVRVLAEAIGNRDLKYVRFPYEESRGTMMKMGLSDSVATAMTETMRAINDGPFLKDARRTQETTTPTSIEEFARTFARHFNQ